MKTLTLEEAIKSIHVDKANLQHIAETGKINGTLLTEIKKVLDLYAQSKQAEALSEIEKLKEDKREALKIVESIEKDFADLRLLKSKYEDRCFQLESQNKELMEALKQKENIIQQWFTLWNPVDEFVRNHPSIKLGESVSKKALELLKNSPYITFPTTSEKRTFVVNNPNGESTIITTPPNQTFELKPSEKFDTRTLPNKEA
jgi:hypothetical protein